MRTPIFYLRDDISRETAGICNTISSIKNDKTNRRKVFEKRYMNLTVAEACQIYLEEDEVEPVCKSIFFDLRPKHVICVNKICLFDFDFLISALESIKRFPKSHRERLEEMCCNIYQRKMYVVECKSCFNAIPDILPLMFPNDLNIYWKKWKQEENKF